MRCRVHVILVNERIGLEKERCQESTIDLLGQVDIDVTFGGLICDSGILKPVK